MKNKDALGFFAMLAKNKKDDQQSVKLANNSDYSDIDAKFILKYVNSSSNILDIGTGTGLIVNRIYDKVSKIVCIEQYSAFTKFIKQSLNIEVINKNFFEYDTKEKFDLITIFGVMHYVNEPEAIEIYKKCYKFLKPNGKMIIKNQFGICEDVNVSGYSEEQKMNYYAQYRNIKKETDILNKVGFAETEIFDIYPKKANRWENTRFYAITCTKKS